MCGRYSLYSEKKVTEKFGIKIIPNYNISPGNRVLVLDNKLSISNVLWGFNYSWLKNKMLINARLESINNSSFYSDYNKCVFIADGYFEWKKNKAGKVPYFHYLKNNLIFMAGLYTNTHAVIITIQSNKYISHIHHRQPLIIEEKYINCWLKENKIIPINSNSINYYKISNNINNPKNNIKNLLLKIN